MERSIDEAGRRRLTWTTAEVCDALGISEPTFAGKREELRKAGFPGKLPGINAYSIAAVRDWVAHNGGTYVPFAERGAEITADISQAAIELERLYSGREAA